MLYTQDHISTLPEFVAGLGDLLGMQVVPTQLADSRARLDTRGPKPVLLLDIDSPLETQRSAVLEAVALLLKGPAAAPGARRVPHLRLVEPLDEAG